MRRSFAVVARHSRGSDNVLSHSSFRAFHGIAAVSASRSRPLRPRDVTRCTAGSGATQKRLEVSLVAHSSAVLNGVLIDPQPKRELSALTIPVLSQLPHEEYEGKDLVPINQSELPKLVGSLSRVSRTEHLVAFVCSCHASTTCSPGRPPRHTRVPSTCSTGQRKSAPRRSRRRTRSCSWCCRFRLSPRCAMRTAV